MLFWDTEMFVKSPQPPGSMTSKATATASSLEKQKLKECKNIIPSQGFLNHLSLFYLTPGVIMNVKNRSGSSKIHEFHDVELKMLKNKREIHNAESSGDLRKIMKNPWFGMFLRVYFWQQTSMTCWRQPSYKVSLSDSLSPNEECLGWNRNDESWPIKAVDCNIITI